MIRKKALSILSGCLLLLGLTTASHAALTFDLNLRTLNDDPNISGLNDYSGIEVVSFFGLATLTVDPQAGTFTEDGHAELKFYDIGSGYTPFFTTGSELQFKFSDLTGTYEDMSGATIITFDAGQTISLNYVDQANSIDMALADFAIGPGSGGVVLNEHGAPQVQTYHLSLTKEYFDIFPEANLYFEASLTASDFFPSTYVMSGEMAPVPLPGSLIVLCSGLVGLAGLRRKSA